MINPIQIATLEAKARLDRAQTMLSGAILARSRVEREKAESAMARAAEDLRCLERAGALVAACAE